MANKWNITTKDAGLIGGEAKGSVKELQARIDSLDKFYTEGMAKIERAYKASFTKAKAKKVVKEPVKEVITKK